MTNKDGNNIQDGMSISFAGEILSAVFLGNIG